MAGFYVYETADLSLVLEPEGVLADLSEAVVTIAQSGARRIDKRGEDLAVDSSAGTIGVHLAQDETAKFKPGTAEVQVNLYYTDAERDVSTVAKIAVHDNLYRKELP